MNSFCVVSSRLPLGMPRRSRCEFVLTFLLPSAKKQVCAYALRCVAYSKRIPAAPQTHALGSRRRAYDLLTGAENIAIGGIDGRDQHRDQKQETQAGRDRGDYAENQ